jgi:uncharacterized Ntn-hydrolase superfamily protein
MTWSIVARDPSTGAFGVAVATRFFAVGALCPHALGRVGALATQALVNPTYGPRGLRLLAEGVSAPDVVRILTESDAGRAQRQLHAIDAAGRIGVHTGDDCIPWCGHRVEADFSVAGNMLAGQDVVDDTAASFMAAAARPLAERLILALQAGEAAGGDKRGKQSAALIVYGTEEYPDLDLRVDDHADPLAELRRLYHESSRTFAVFRKFMATRTNPAGTFDRAAIDAEIARLQQEEREGRAAEP